jgi:hypothetical protein
MEANGLSGIYLFNTPFELFPALFTLTPKAYYKSSLHDQLQSTAGPQMRREESVDFA